MKSLRIGCNRFTLPRPDYWRRFEVVEVDQTFYEPPKLATLERWRKEAPPGSQFVVRAWQLITHEAQSPGYARLSKPLPAASRGRVGRLQLTDEVLAAYTATREAARALGSSMILFDTPASFTPSAQSRQAWRQFAGRVDRTGVILLWEPRGLWEPADVAALCRELDIVPVVDPLRPTMLESAAAFEAAREVRRRRRKAAGGAAEAPAAVAAPPAGAPAAGATAGVGYFRLPGLGASRRYDDAALLRLAEACLTLDEGFVIFANPEAGQDGGRFAALVSGEALDDLEAAQEALDDDADEKPDVDALDALDEDDDEDDDDDDDDEDLDAEGDLADEDLADEDDDDDDDEDDEDEDEADGDAKTEDKVDRPPPGRKR